MFRLLRVGGCRLKQRQEFNNGSCRQGRFEGLLNVLHVCAGQRHIAITPGMNLHMAVPNIARKRGEAGKPECLTKKRMCRINN